MELHLYRKIVAAAAMGVFVLVSCTKESAAPEVNNPHPAPGGTVIRTGGFLSNVHPTSGTVRYVTDNGRRYLVFENFRTDNGPDLRVYLSRAADLNDAQEVGKLTAASGNFSYELAGHLDPLQYNYVLIWCRPFSVLFGHAVLR
jgi:hypothetical protein